MTAICSAKETGHKCHIFAWFHLYKIFRIGKSIGTKSRALIASGWQKGRVTANGHRASLWDDRNALKLECNDCTTLWIYWKPGFSDEFYQKLKKVINANFPQTLSITPPPKNRTGGNTFQLIPWGQYYSDTTTRQWHYKKENYRLIFTVNIEPKSSTK